MGQKLESLFRKAESHISWAPKTYIYILTSILKLSYSYIRISFNFLAQHIYIPNLNLRFCKWILHQTPSTTLPHSKASTSIIMGSCLRPTMSLLCLMMIKCWDQVLRCSIRWWLISFHRPMDATTWAWCRRLKSCWIRLLRFLGLLFLDLTSSTTNSIKSRYIYIYICFVLEKYKF